MLLSDFDYILPENLIAQLPSEDRTCSKMMVLDKNSKTIENKYFFDIVDLLNENDVLVLNNTRVIPARLFGHKINVEKKQEIDNNPAKVEVFLLKEIKEKHWEALLKPSKRIKPQTVIEVSGELSVKALELVGDGKWLVELIYEGAIYDILDKVGNIPLPPYIERKMSDEEIKKLDYERYQTVFAQNAGSVAAPTAGLHFSKDILEKLEKKGVEVCYVTLNVGLGTFKPVKCENILEHKMDSEEFEIPEETALLLSAAKASGKNIVAVGTTSVRTLETAFRKHGKIKACKDCSRLFIYPPYEFKVVDKLITNFHLPKSTLLMLVSAFSGKELIFDAYRHAIENNYRFYSYGDCMFIG